MTSLPAGWYKDPADPSTQRYWDGEGWVGAAIPADAVPPEGPPGAPPPPAAPAPQTGPGLGVPPPGWTPPGWTPPGSAPPGSAPPGYPVPPGSAPPGYPVPPGHSVPPGYPAPPAGMAFPFPMPVRPHGFALAGLGPRLMARILDILAVLLLNVVVNGYFAYQFAQEFAPLWQAAMANPFGEQPQPNARMETLLWTMLIVATLLWLLYEAPSTGSRGQTLGKWIMHIKVLPLESTEPLGFGRAFRRWARLGLWTPLWGCAGLGFLMQLIDSASPLFDPNMRQALHDKTARTVVVALPPDDRQAVGTTSGGGSSGSPDSPGGGS
jgi:uncharacterized RDD family membrane protein YckC